MTSQLLIYSVKVLLENKTTKSVLHDYNYDWKFIEDYYLRYTTNALVVSPRVGINNHPFVHNYDFLDYTMPDFDPNFNKTFSDVSDETALNLLENLPDDKNLLLNWSGGIDSTVPLVAILKNWPVEDLQRLVINMNDTSIFENPYLYHNHIKDKIKTRNSYVPVNYSKYVTVYGDPEMPSTSTSKYISMINNYPGIYDKNYIEAEKEYIEHFSNLVNHDFASKNYEKIIENIQSIDGQYPIETVADLVWWENFNLSWKGCSGLDFYIRHHSNYPVDTFLLNNICWFNNVNYQKWIMKNKGPGVTYGNNCCEIKLAHKKYIHEFDSNDFYLHFKSKLPSGSIRGKINPNTCMITSDFRNLNLEANLKEIINYIPTILKNY